MPSIHLIDHPETPRMSIGPCGKTAQMAEEQVEVGERVSISKTSALVNVR